MASEFNNFFSKIGKDISDSVQQTVKKPEDYIPDYNQDLPKFSLDNTGPDHIVDIVKSFDSKSSLDLDGLSLKFRRGAHFLNPIRNKIHKAKFKRKSLSFAYANLLELIWCQKYEYVDIRPFRVNYK